MVELTFETKPVSTLTIILTFKEVYSVPEIYTSLVVGQLKVRLFMIGKCTSMYLRMQERGRETNVPELTLNWKRPLSVVVVF